MIFRFLIEFLESAIDVEDFEKKNVRHDSSIPEVIYSQRRVYLHP